MFGEIEEEEEEQEEQEQEQEQEQEEQEEQEEEEEEEEKEEEEGEELNCYLNWIDLFSVFTIIMAKTFSVKHLYLYKIFSAICNSP